MATEAEVKQILEYLERSKAVKGAVKAVGDWEIDVLAIPFDKMDSDQQWFDNRTDIMPDAFQTPLVAYQHGIAPGGDTQQGQPVQIGRVQPGSLSKQSDGWHVRVMLDKFSELAGRVMDAVRNGYAAVSSGSISHLARLDIGGQLIPYVKDMPGRIAVWPFAEISIWDAANGNYQAANPYAVAVPVMKAAYKAAGLSFPEVDNGTADARKQAVKIAIDYLASHK